MPANRPTVGPRGGRRGLAISQLASLLGVCRSEKERLRWLIGPRKRRDCRGDWRKVHIPVISLRLCSEELNKGRAEIGTELSGCHLPLTVEFLQTLE